MRGGFGQVATMAMLSVGGFASGGSDIFGNATHCPNPNARYTDSGKPLSKRRKRRLRAKARASHEGNKHG